MTEYFKGVDPGYFWRIVDGRIETWVPDDGIVSSSMGPSWLRGARTKIDRNEVPEEFRTKEEEKNVFDVEYRGIKVPETYLTPAGLLPGGLASWKAGVDSGLAYLAGTPQPEPYTYYTDNDDGAFEYVYRYPIGAQGGEVWQGRDSRGWEKAYSSRNDSACSDRTEITRDQLPRWVVV